MTSALAHQPARWLPPPAAEGWVDPGCMEKRKYKRQLLFIISQLAGLPASRPPHNIYETSFFFSFFNPGHRPGGGGWVGDGGDHLLRGIHCCHTDSDSWEAFLQKIRKGFQILIREYFENWKPLSSHTLYDGVQTLDNHGHRPLP